MHDGYAVMQGRFPEHLREALVADAGRYRFTAPHPRAGGAFAMATLDEEEGAARRAATWLADAAQRAGLTGFTPNEASYQRYLPEGNGLPPHRDQRYYGFCIAIVTLQGAARFAIHASRETDDVIAQWTTCPGEVILLRGWQSHTDSDPRPYHRVDPPTNGPRLMFQIRHNLAATTPPSPLLSTLSTAEIDQATQQAGLPPAPLTPQPRRKEASTSQRPDTMSG